MKGREFVLIGHQLSSKWSPNAHIELVVMVDAVIEAAIPETAVLIQVQVERTDMITIVRRTQITAHNLFEKV